jgi:eukaryotic-like serine/threonine-protein kinase
MRYSRGERLGTPGTFGEVFSCVQKDNKGRVVRDDLAIKYLKKELCDDEDMRDRFRAEVRYQRKLDHENVVPVIASNLSAERPFMVMPKASVTLTHALKTGIARDHETAFEIFAGVVRGVAHAHGQDVLHRDLKPDNILMFDDVPKVADFGLGKNLQSEIDRTQTGTRLGSLPYMAPEQWGRARHARKPADVYSLGKILWELVVGQVPRPFGPDLGLIEDTRLREYIARCCEDEPASRFPDAGAALSVFEAIQVELGPSPAAAEQLAHLIDLWWLTSEDEDIKVLRKIDRLLDKHSNDEELYYETIPQFPEQVLDDYITRLPSEFDEMIRRYATRMWATACLSITAMTWHGSIFGRSDSTRADSFVSSF